jgi:hypothetical protein
MAVEEWLSISFSGNESAFPPIVASCQLPVKRFHASKTHADRLDLGSGPLLHTKTILIVTPTGC